MAFYLRSVLALACLAWAMLLPGALLAKPQAVPVWVYQNYPPFVVDAEARAGLSFDLATRLTELSRGAFAFEVTVASRSRINHEIAKTGSGAVLWVNEVWFADSARERYLWTPVLMEDATLVLSPASRPAAYEGPSSIMGKQAAVVRGYRLHLLAPYFATEAITRVDLSSEQQVMNFLAHGRADVGIVSRSLADYMMRDRALADRLYVAEERYSEFSRRLMFTTDLAGAHAFARDAIQGLATDPTWRARLAGYGVADLWPEMPAE